jgi:hypothetical protein
LHQIYLVAWLIGSAQGVFPFLLIFLWDFLPFVEAQHPAVEQLVVPLEQALLGFVKVGVIEPMREVGPDGRQ